MPPFELSKWYADCTTDEGEALILYSAELRWRGPAIRYTSLLTYTHGGPPRSRFSVRKQPEPHLTDSGIGWKSRAWNVEARWSEPGAAARELLYESDAGSVEWNCVAPRSAALIRVGDKCLRGWGYVEHLRLSLPPWRLPIRTLRWGRFINTADALVWIDWRGAHHRQAVYLNGAAAEAERIEDGEIVLAGRAAALALGNAATLREGALGATALAVIPNLNRLFPHSILNVRERKWLSRAVLRRPNRADSVGMAIHEVVEWP